MIDTEVERLRRLRDCALRVRAVARTASRQKYSEGDQVLGAGGRAAWRIARVVSGRLRAHPYARFQRGAGLGVLLANSVNAHRLALQNRTRPRMLLAFAQELKALVRELDDARSLTWVAELSDAFGRSQQELRALTAALARETATAIEASVNAPAMGRVAPDPTGRLVVAAPGPTAPSDADWPYLAF